MTIQMTVYLPDGSERVVETDLPPRPNTDPEMLAFIVGPAVVFSDRVWY